MGSFQVEITVQQDIAHTWEYFFNQISNWWPKTFFTSERTLRFQIETYIGGKMFEDFGEGDGLIWGHVIGVDYLHTVDVRGSLTKTFGGPAISFGKFELTAENGSTCISYSCDFIGSIEEKTVQSIEQGWQNLLEEHFKPYCQSRN